MEAAYAQPHASRSRAPSESGGPSRSKSTTTWYTCRSVTRPGWTVRSRGPGTATQVGSGVAAGLGSVEGDDRPQRETVRRFGRGHVGIAAARRRAVEREGGHDVAGGVVTTGAALWVADLELDVEIVGDSGPAPAPRQVARVVLRRVEQASGEDLLPVPVDEGPRQLDHPGVHRAAAGREQQRQACQTPHRHRLPGGRRRRLTPVTRTG